ncbi:glucuronate isomerase [Litoreibacter roseus]|uniref:Uronate isomerase n=1 Tax=Litoreibacter roseus TaxID=2601869 RepID=A0A6N6JJW8_9RHOB|nr:glucuronate isomerase [Litoreibacter roseus]GFE65482.1 uronate isomerase [Litoreibacter roseus]
MQSEITLPSGAAEIYETVRDAPIVSPHGHCDPRWFAEDTPFQNPVDLILRPDHYLFRMLHSQGIRLSEIGLGQSAEQHDNRAIFRLFAAQWHLFLGTPSRLWLDHTFRTVFDIRETLSPETAEAIYDRIEACLSDPAFRPRALFDRFNIEILATTDPATDPLSHHARIQDSDWGGRVIPTFRPDAVLDPSDPRFDAELASLERATDTAIQSFGAFLGALRKQRAVFAAMGATATDHAIETLQTAWLDRTKLDELFAKARSGTISSDEAQIFYAHMLTEMAQMSAEDGLVMQIHAGSRRNTNTALYEHFGRDMGADIPVRTDWVRGLEPLLNRVGHAPSFRLIAFTLDESTYARELGPMAGHWPCLRLGPPWWFHDSVAGILRYFDQVVETAGYANLAGFNDDTRAFMSIPARHDIWRRAVALHLNTQIERGFFGRDDALRLADLLATDLARDAYNLGGV